MEKNLRLKRAIPNRQANQRGAALSAGKKQQALLDHQAWWFGKNLEIA